MQSLIGLLLRAALRLSFKLVMGLPLPVRAKRAWMEVVAMTTLSTPGVRRHDEQLGSMRCVRMAAEGQPSKHAILFLHGGAYIGGSPSTHDAITTALASRSGAEVHVPDYRLAPEHPYPAALDDAMRAYQALLARYGAENLLIAGDSAGGGLTLCLALALRDARRPLPAGIALISPWVDLGLSGESMQSRAQADPMLSRRILQGGADSYRGGLQASDPRLSPLFADLSGLPPFLVLVGEREILLSDSQRLAARLEATGNVVELQVAPGMWHDYPLHARLLKSADAALQAISDFAHQRWASRAGNEAA